ncbi:HNH endonuclease [Mesorhizobium amorphae]|uniref:HNH endonuclease n=1 Tax=Mesorhizobium amorphae TaxID=71433 RepID=UPI001C905243
MGPFEFDHFTPFSRGGDSSSENIVLACLPCNRAKGSALPSDFLRKSAAQCHAKAEKHRKVAQALLERS